MAYDKSISDPTHAVKSEMGINRSSLLWAGKIALFGRVINLLLGFLLLFIVIAKLPSEEQGVYYNLVALVSIQMIFEMGMSQSISQKIAAVRASGIYNQESNFSARKLGGILKKISFIYFLLSMILVAVVFQYVYYFGSVYELSLTDLILLSLLIGLSYFLSGINAVLDGFQKLVAVASSRALKSTTFLGALVSLIITDTEVADAVIIALTASVIIGLLIQTKNIMWLTRFLLMKNHVYFSWRKEIFSFQWRLGVAWITGYLLTHGYVLFIGAVFGLSESGDIGLLLNIVNTVTSITFVVVSTSLTTVGFLLERAGEAAADKLLLGRCKIAASIYLLFCLLIGLCDFLYDNFLTAILTISFPASVDLSFCAILIGLVLCNFCIASYFRVRQTDIYWYLGLFQVLILVVYFSFFYIAGIDLDSFMMPLVISSLICGVVPGLYLMQKERRMRKSCSM